VNGSATSGPVSFTWVEVAYDTAQSGKCSPSWTQLRFSKPTMQSPKSIVQRPNPDLQEVKSIQQFPKSS